MVKLWFIVHVDSGVCSIKCLIIIVLGYPEFHCDRHLISLFCRKLATHCGTSLVCLRRKGQI